MLLDIPEVEVDPKDDSGQTLLSWAAENGHEPLVKLLLERGKAEVGSYGNDGLWPMLRPARNWLEAAADLLCETDYDQIGSKGNAFRQTPLWKAISLYHPAVVKLLLETDKVEVDPEDGSGRTPLSWATRDGNEAMVKLLLEIDKADVNSKDEDG